MYVGLIPFVPSAPISNRALCSPSGAPRKQAVALRISANKAAFIACRFIGAQDTPYDHSGRHYFKRCYIQGTVDFIYGNGLSLYKGCHPRAMSNNYGTLTTQERACWRKQDSPF
ncbi:Probable pectinesterase 53 [Ancistrocladus abbreviatus]